ncbi:MAG: hypothetical protein RBR22_10050 [Desulfuromonas sp.]|nr:hypothetical protein [Desulfuromonas sp.]
MQYIFVYNADSGRLNSMLDIAHKMLSPSTYKCDLCSLTHDALSEKAAWSKFKKSSGIDLLFLHKDEFEQQYSDSFAYPVILEKSDKLRVILSAEEIAHIASTEELIAKIKAVAK